ncbi:hypothetical protein ABZ930_39300 [Streptomyces sp. NPDC046716]|uniref:hypothetical protein n=1 Tax=Streptomyces sp. NPDC046716 TaxID=3157093 RepID=UPI0033E9213B
MTANELDLERQKALLLERASAAEGRADQCLASADAHMVAAQSRGSGHHLRLAEVYRRIADAHQTSANAQRQAVMTIESTLMRTAQLLTV